MMACPVRAPSSVRIMYFTHEFHPTFRPDVTVLFGSALPELGVQTELVTLAEPGALGESAWPGGPAILAPLPSGAMARRVGVMRHALRVLQKIRADRCDVIQVRDMPVVAAMAMSRARWLGLPFVYWMSYPMPEGSIALARERGLSAGLMKFLYPWVAGQVGRWLMKRWILPNADHVFVQSERMREELADQGHDSSRMTPVPMGVDASLIQGDAVPPLACTGAADSIAQRLAGRRVIGYLGTLDRPRRVEKLFEMLDMVRRSEPRALLLLVGDTEDAVHRAWLKSQAVEAGVAEHVVWTGWLPAASARSLIVASEVALSAFPRGELLDSASPTKLMEYLALGVPVVCNDNPDQAFVVAQSGAGICVPYTPADFAVAVLKTFALSDEQRQTQAAQGRRWVAENRTYPRLAATVAPVYQALLAGRTR